MKISKKFQLGILLSVLILSIGFNNCSQSPKFGAASSMVEVGSPLNQVTATPPLLSNFENSKTSQVQFFSLQNGEPSSDLYLGEVVNGVVSNVGGEDAWGCADYVKDNSPCDDKTKWQKLPVPGWSYVSETRSWVMSQPLDDLFLANKPFVMYFGRSQK